MNCLAFRRALGADPNHASAESLAHRAECPACEKYAQEMLRLNGVIKRALEVPVRSPRQIRDASHVRWYAMAASLVLAVGIGAGLWLLGYPQPSLASEVVGHLLHEPHALNVDNDRVSTELLDAALQAKGMRLLKPLSDVTYLQSCPFRGGFVPHIVVQTDQGPVTVMLLPNEKISSNQRFDEKEYHGVLVPMEQGSIAVVATDAALVDSVAEKVKASIAWGW